MLDLKSFVLFEHKSQDREVGLGIYSIIVVLVCDSYPAGRTRFKLNETFLGMEHGISNLISQTVPKGVNTDGFVL
jgi:hypothetical protein